jgi:hypothetical protein
MISKIKFIILTFSIVISQVPENYAIEELLKQNINIQRRSIIEDFKSKSVVDLQLINNNSIVVGTSGGLGLISENITFNSYEDNNLAVGGNPALVTYPDNNLIVLSGVEELNYNGENVVAGTGISWSVNNGDTWKYIEQPEDSPPDCENIGCENPLNSPAECECSPAASGCSWDVPSGTCNYIDDNYIIFQWGGQSLSSLPIQTTAKNVTYDISVDLVSEYVYAASWAGMLRRFKYTDIDPIWELVPLPTDNLASVNCGEYASDYVYNPIDPIISGNLNSGGNHNHKAFSVYSDSYNQENYLWAGTANGVNKGIVNNETGCIDWYHYTTSDGLAGDWIIDIVPQNIGNEIPRIWLISWNMGGPSPHGLTFSDDNGENWNVIDNFIDEDAIVYNLYFNENELYASTSEGLFYADANNIDLWNKIEFPDHILESLDYFDCIDLDDNELDCEKVYTSISNENNFFIGTPKGLVYITNESNVWDWSKSSKWQWETYIPYNQDIVDKNKLMIWPNPFLIGQNFNVDFSFKTNSNYGVLDIYNFSMDKVKSVDCSNYNQYYGNLECSWNGKNKNNITVANGVYFCKLTVGKNETWEKLMVINTKKGDY